MRVLIVGWFSFSNGHATAGDLLSRDLICKWLSEESIAFEFATDPPFTGGVNWRLTNPGDYSHVIFVCGPFGRGELEAQFLEHFSGCRLLGVNLSMGVPLAEWNPFDFLIERDSSERTNPDLVFGAKQNIPPVVGLCLVEEHPEARVDRAHAAIKELIKARELAVVPIDTRLDRNAVGLRTTGEVEALIGRVDALITTRLHGLVLALRNGVPVLAVDAVPGGSKILKQCALLGWPNVFSLEQIDLTKLERGLDFALSVGARAMAKECAQRAEEQVARIRTQLIAGLTLPELEASFHTRQQLQNKSLATVDILPAQTKAAEMRPTFKSWGRRILNRAGTALRRE